MDRGWISGCNMVLAIGNLSEVVFQGIFFPLAFSVDSWEFNTKDKYFYVDRFAFIMKMRVRPHSSVLQPACSVYWCILYVSWVTYHCQNHRLKPNF